MSQRYLICGCGVSAALALWLGFLAFDAKAAIPVVKYGGYWILFAASGLLLLNLIQRVQEHRKRTGKLWGFSKGATLTIIGVSVLLGCMQSKDYKVTMDEPVLAATALQMHQEKQVLTVTRAYEVGGIYHLLGGYIDKRPIFYPFLVSLMHDLTGYRAMQGMCLNLLLTPVFIALLYRVGVMLGGPRAGYLAILLFSTVPLLAINVNGGGFELLNLVMILALLLAIDSYRRRTDAASLNTMLLIGVLLAQARYESVLYILPIALVVLWTWYRSRRIELTKTAIMIPLLLICYPLQQIIFKEHPELWQLKDGAEQAFSIKMALPNLEHAANFFFALVPDQSSSVLLSILFCLAVIGEIVRRAWRCLQRRTEEPTPDLTAFWLIAAIMVGSFGLLMCYHWGQIDDIVATRIALPFILFQVLFIAYGSRFIGPPKRVQAILIGISAVYLVGVTLPQSVRTDFLERVDGRPMCLWLDAKIDTLEGDSPLFLTDRHLIPIIKQQSALPLAFTPARIRHLYLHWQLQSFDRIYICDILEPDPEVPGQYVSTSSVDDRFTYSELDRFSLIDGRIVRLSRLDSVVLNDAQHAAYIEMVQRLDQKSVLPIAFYAETLP